jgi:hypothetical protein
MSKPRFKISDSVTYDLGHEVLQGEIVAKSITESKDGFITNVMAEFPQKEGQPLQLLFTDDTNIASYQKLRLNHLKIAKTNQLKFI